MILDVVAETTTDLSWILVIPILLLLTGVGIKLTLLIKGIEHADKTYTVKEEAALKKMKSNKNKKHKKNKHNHKL